MDLSQYSGMTHLHMSNNKSIQSYSCMSHCRTDMNLRLLLNHQSYHSWLQVNIDCWMRSRRDRSLPYRVLLFHHTNRCRCLTSHRWFVCSRVLRCTSRRQRSWCTSQWKWTAYCTADCCYARNILVVGTITTPHSPPHHPDPCSSLLPRTLLCPKLAFDCSRTHTFCHPLL